MSYEYNTPNTYHYKSIESYNCNDAEYESCNHLMQLNQNCQCSNTNQYRKYHQYNSCGQYTPYKCGEPTPYYCNTCKYDQTYKMSCFPDNLNIYTRWQDVCYAGDCNLPIPETPDAGCYPLCFFKRGINGEFLNPFGNNLILNIKNPHTHLNLESEFNYLSGIQCDLSYEQVQIARYWGDGPPTKQFIPIVDILIDTYSVKACDAARILYVLNGALNDTFVITWYFKYLYNIVRPNQYNQCFKTVLCTPMHPTYPAGHSTSAGCMAEILSYYFPKEREKLFTLARQCSNSRLYAGVHFKLDCDEGIKLGISIGKSVIEYISTQYRCDNHPVDKIYTEYKEANIIPITMNQYLPYNRKNTCSSFLLDVKC